MNTKFDKTDRFETEIRPLLKVLQTVCKKEGIPFVIAVQPSSEEILLAYNMEDHITHESLRRAKKEIRDQQVIR